MNYFFTVRLTDEGFEVVKCDKHWIKSNHFRYDNGDENVLIPAHKWKFAHSWYWLPLGDFYIESMTVEEGIKLALRCVALGIFEEGNRSSDEMIALTQRLSNLIHFALEN